jgi:hypothetical protein
MRSTTATTLFIVVTTALCLQAPTSAQTTRGSAEQLTTDIRQRDSAARRAQALADARTMLKGNPPSQAAALEAIWHWPTSSSIAPASPTQSSRC